MAYVNNTQRVAEQWATNHAERGEYTYGEYLDDRRDNHVDQALADVQDILSTFDVKLTDADVDLESLQPAAAILWMENYSGDFEFVLDVRRRWARNGVVNVATIRGLLNTMRAEVRRDAPQPFVEGERIGQFQPVIDLLATATKNGLKTPRLHIMVGGNKVIIKRVTRGRNEGAYYVTGAYADDVYYGKISATGDADARLRSSFLFEQLAQLAADPQGFAVRQGRETICCMFCGRQLDTTESRTVGYGPVCADKFGLPWGTK